MDNNCYYKNNNNNNIMRKIIRPILLYISEAAEAVKKNILWMGYRRPTSGRTKNCQHFMINKSLLKDLSRYISANKMCEI